jgi:hypothetical protein
MCFSPTSPHQHERAPTLLHVRDSLACFPQVTPKAPTSFFGLAYANNKVWVIGGGFKDKSSWSNNTAPGSDATKEIGNSMELDLVSGAWTDLDSQRTIEAAMFGMCSLDITCPTAGAMGKGFCAYSTPWSMMPPSATGICAPCFDFWSEDDCLWAFEYDETSQNLCKSTCHGTGAAADTGSSETAFRYGHGMAPGKAWLACNAAC